MIPLHPGSKAGMISGPLWQAGGTYDESADAHLRAGGGIGIRLAPSRLVVLDADIRLKPVVEGGTAMYERQDGRAQLISWAAEHDLTLPPTLMISTSGRSDGTHESGGWHVYYWQNPKWHIIKDRQVTPDCECKVIGIARYTPGFTVLRDFPVAELPYEWAQALEPAETLRERHESEAGSRDFALQGVNSALTSVKGTLVRNGAWSEADADEIVRFANSLLESPMNARRLEDTVLRPKSWVRGQ
jgi:Bifunctional DNA primase/polymerase, N-terminal